MYDNVIVPSLLNHFPLRKKWEGKRERAVHKLPKYKSLHQLDGDEKTKKLEQTFHIKVLIGSRGVLGNVFISGFHHIF